MKAVLTDINILCIIDFFSYEIVSRLTGGC